MHCKQRRTGSGTSKEAVIKSSFTCECDRELYDSFQCRDRCIRVEASLHCMDRHTVWGVVLGLIHRCTVGSVALAPDPKEAVIKRSSLVNVTRNCMIRYIVGSVVLGLKLRSLYGSLHCRHRSIRVGKLALRCIHRNTVSNVAL